jgi:hypothetical protein
MNYTEKRKFRRLPITLDLSYRKVGSTEDQVYKGCTVNVSPGGLYFEIAENTLAPNDLVKVEFLIPPTEGLLELGGRISGLGKVLRTSYVNSSGKYGTALEFCRSPKLCS